MIWQKLNLIYLLIFGYNLFSDNPIIKKINKITFWLLLPTIIILSIIESYPYQQSNIIPYTSEVVRGEYLTVTFGFNRKTYAASSLKIKTTNLDSCYVIYRTNAYGLKIKKKLILVSKDIKDSVDIKLIGRKFLPTIFDWVEEQ